MLPATGAEDGQRFMAFMLEDKIGVVKLPLTGNPHLAAALIVHPQGVRAVVQPASLHNYAWTKYNCFILQRVCLCLQCFDAVGWASVGEHLARKN